MDGLACLDQLRARHPAVKVVMLSASSNPELVVWLPARCVGLRDQDGQPGDLPPTLRQALEGNVHTAVGGEEGERASAKALGLTERELTILASRPWTLERRDREGVLGRAADGEVPSHEHLSQAGREEPHRGDADPYQHGLVESPIYADESGMTSTVSPVGSDPSSGGTTPQHAPSVDLPRRGRIRRIAEEEHILVILLAGFGLIFLFVFPPALIVNDSWLNLMAGREVVENGLPSVETLTIYGLGSTWTNQRWGAQSLMYGVYSLGGFALLSILACVSVVGAFSLAAAASRSLGAGPRAFWVTFLPVLVAAPWAWSIRAQMLTLPLYTALVWLLASQRERRRGASGWRFRSSSSGPTSTEVVALGALLVVLLGTYRAHPDARSELASKRVPDRSCTARSASHAVQPRHDRALLPPHARRPAFRRVMSRSGIGRHPGPDRLLLRARSPRARHLLARSQEVDDVRHCSARDDVRGRRKRDTRESCGSPSPA